jgi:predicted phosphodiesterase
MAAKACDDATFIELVTKHGPAETARRLKVGVRGVYERRANLEKKYHRQITAQAHPLSTRFDIQHPGRLTAELKNGTMLVGSDAHIWPGPQGPALRAFIKMCDDIRPDFVVMNGDALDFATISRWPGNWEKRPTVQEEIESAQDQLHDIAIAAGRKARRIWTFGNHDARLESKIANTLPELVKLKGVHLKDWFPDWESCWSLWVNDITIKHRGPANGVHSNYQNVLKSGRHLVAGHTHALGYTAFSNYTQELYGMNTGMLANPYSPQFLYLEDNPRNWRQGFLVLTIRDGRLMLPEVVQVWDENSVEFRSNVIKV